MKENWETHWKDYYTILQIHPLAELEIVKAAYGRLAHKYHPDHNPNDQQGANEKFKDINEAFEIISNPEKRGQYYVAYQIKANPKPIITPPQPNVSKNYVHPTTTKWTGMKDRFCPLPLDTNIQRQLKIASAIEYMLLTTTEIGWMHKIALKSDIRYLRQYGKSSGGISIVLGRLEKLKAWSRMFTTHTTDNYYTMRVNKRRG